MVNLKDYITDTNDFPSQGIVFKDINPIYKDPQIWKQAMKCLEDEVIKKKPDVIAGIESRGFIIAAALGYKLEIGFLPIRKSNKLPGNIIGLDYQLEYGNDRLELQPDLIEENNKIIIVDDLLATGGTAYTAEKLIAATRGELIGYGFLVELSKLNGRKILNQKLSIKSSIVY